MKLKPYRSFKLALATVAFSSIWFSPGASADVARIKQTGYAEMSSGEENCFQLAIADARQKALLKVMKKVGKGAGKKVVDSALEEAEDGMRGVKILSKKDMKDGRCRIKARFKIDETFLASLVNQGTAGAVEERSLSVGTVVRFLINGEVASSGKVDTQAALSKLGQELREMGIEVVNLDPLMDKYANQQSLEWEQVALAEGEKVKAGKQISSSQAIKQLVNTIQEIWEDFPKNLRKFDAVAVAQIFVSPLGQDPQGPGYISEVVAYIKLIQIGENGNVSSELASVTIPGTIDGQTQEKANLEAMFLSIENSVSVIGKTLAKQ